MDRNFRVVALGPLVLAIGLSGCGSNADPADRPAPSTSIELPEIDEIDLPTEAEATEAARRLITPENAEEEFQALLEEIESDAR